MNHLELDELPLDTRFTLGEEITPLQKAFLLRHGFLIFGNVASKEEVNTKAKDFAVTKSRRLCRADGRLV